MARAMKFPELRRHMIELFKTHPNSSYKTSEITHEMKRHYSKVDTGIVSYHRLQLSKEGMLRLVKYGTFAWNPEYESPEEKAKRVKEHIANGGGLIVQASTQSGFFQTSSGEKIDMRFIDHLKRSFSLLKQRMQSELPANKVFYPEDRELLDSIYAELMDATLTDAQREVLKRREQPQVQSTGAPITNGHMKSAVLAHGKG